mgnify:CR=1 FL=1
MVSYLEDGAREDLNFESFGQGLLSALLFAGMLLGGSVIGVFSDKYGRRRMMTATLWLCVLSGGVSAFSVNMPMFLALRFLAGLGVGGSIPVVFTYFAEFLPAKNRGRYIIFLASFWMLGAIFTAGLAWISIEQVGWRVFVALCVIPALTGAILSTFHFIPGSFDAPTLPLLLLRVSPHPCVLLWCCGYEWLLFCTSFSVSSLRAHA